MTAIPPIDLTRQYHLLNDQISKAVTDVLSSGQYIGGSAVTSLETQLAANVGVTHCVSCNSGTDALYLALRALNIGKGDEVITAPFTFAATAEVIAMTGAKPVFVDIATPTFNLNLEKVETAITKNTKAIIPIHLFGQPVNMTELMRIAKAHNLWVIEDCAQATGATWQNQPVGSWGEVGCFSFFPTKNLGGCGDGGALVTNNPELAKTARILANHGQREKYKQESIGMNSRLDTLQAAILLIKLPYLEFWNKQRREIAKRYQDLLSQVDNILLPTELARGEGVWNQYTIRISRQYRDQLRSHLQQQGIGSMIYYPFPLHLQPAYKHLGYEKGDFPISEQMAQEVLSLPMFPGLSHQEQDQVATAIKTLMKETLEPDN
ncbi:DegT/DnrJ/EryC1/StrS family aminotransferase [Euhalothece natronophila Z-M001]|uniref:DegT/DnrJ/EryC1/StrS family aminotransferase n=1 Tax=Euhalothece natronophila Z-M001 TaxID=522448 RepID=A0A5B8NKB3_9CHRO|nr:DegT/DnrJ/EryC1/StrS family aminotransferase [Euhalothece natronophila]QDZ38800.1 DegT/DnrJ/EryC1/StrS family aminotransferase [Euhalothece natronophila Z-M001]